MDIIKYTVKELYEKLDNKEILPYDIYNAYSKNINDNDSNIKAYLSLNKFEDTQEEIDKYNLKYNIPIGIKDNIAVEGLPLTASSKMLEGYISPYNASLIENLNNNGIYVLGKLNLDEFASGIGSQNSEIQKTSNPVDLERIPGGSSGGTAAAVAGKLAPWGLGTDTGGSIRQPAAFCGVVGYKPSYGLISRYGVMPLASSLDHVGIITKTVMDTAILLNIISVKTEEDKDPNTIVVDNDYTEKLNNYIKGKKIGVIKELIDSSSEIVKEKMDEAIGFFKESGVEMVDIEISYLEQLSTIYTIINYAETSSNLSRFDGVRYGNRQNEETYEDMIKETRTKGFGLEIKKRIILGSYFLQENNYNKYYIKAAKIRRLLIDDLKTKFKEYDAIIMPTVPFVAPKKDELENINKSIFDKYTVIANLAGLPAISIPFKNTELPIGLQIMGGQFEDELVLNIANYYEENFK